MQILGFAFTMVTGGNDTTTGLLRCRRRTADPLSRAAGPAPGATIPARRRDRRAPSAVSACAMPRPNHDAVELHGRVIPARPQVLLLYGAADRDPREFGPDADQFDIDRVSKTILTFATAPTIASAGSRPAPGPRHRRGAPGPMPGLRGRPCVRLVRSRALRAALRRPAVPGRRQVSTPWLGPRRDALATDRILDAAGEIFARDGCARPRWATSRLRPDVRGPRCIATSTIAMHSGWPSSTERLAAWARRWPRGWPRERIREIASSTR